MPPCRPLASSGVVSATTLAVALTTPPGVGPMWDLSLDAVHTFAVSATRAVAHNCGGKRVLGDPSAVESNLDGSTCFHSTNKEGYEGIMRDDEAVLKADGKGRVFAARDVYSPAEAEQYLFIGNPKYAGIGDYVIVVQAPEGANFEPRVQKNEFMNRSTVRVPIFNMLYAGPNPW